MNNSYTRFAELLKDKDATPYRVHKETGIATATLSDWKNGKCIPKQDKMMKIAKYLDVPVEYLNTGNSDKNVVDYTLLINDDIRAIIETFTELNREHQEMFIKYAEFLRNDSKNSK